MTLSKEWCRGFVIGAVSGLMVGWVTSPVHAQTLTPPVPSYTFTFTSEQTDAVYAALERSSLIQSWVTGERSPRLDTIQAQMKQAILKQQADAAKVADAAKAAAEKPKDEPKQEAPKQ